MTTRRLLLSLFVLVALLPCAFGQEGEKKEDKKESRENATKKVLQKAQEEYRIYFKEPKTALEYWAALSFEIQVGKFDIAAYHLDKLLQLKEGDEDLLRIEEAEGLNTFLRLKLVQEWNRQPELEAEARQNVEKLIDRVLTALEKQLGDSERLQRFIDNLANKVPEVRAFSLYQLKRAKHRAAPALAEALRDSTRSDLTTLKRAMLEMDPEIMPPLLELYRARSIKDAEDIDFRLNLLWLAKGRLEKRAIPYLWYMSAAPEYPKVVRDQARETLAYLLDTKPDRLPAPKVALTQLAEQYYQYKVRFPDVTEEADRDDPTKLLPMPGFNLWMVGEDGRLNSKPQMLKARDARLRLGMQSAREAMELDKAYLPAQALYLAFLLEREFAGKPYDGQLDKLVTEKRPPALQRLLAKIDLDLLTTVLERAMAEQNYAVMLPLIDAAGQRGEVRLAQSSSGGSTGLLERLLYYPDRRVQYAAARALLRLPTSLTPVASTRVVDVLRRFLTAGPAGKVLIVYAKDERAAELRNAAKNAGYDSEAVATVKAALELLHRSADFDAILLSDSVPQGELPHVLAQLRGDHDAGRLPLLLIATAAQEAERKLVAARTRNAFVLPAVLATKGPELKIQLEEAIKFAAAPEPLRMAPQDQQRWLQYEVRRTNGQSLSELERKRFAGDSLDWFAQMARGELPGYDLKPAKHALLQALQNDETAVQALRILARFASVEEQQRLASMVLDSKKGDLRVLAAQELNRHIQKNGLALAADQIKMLRVLEQQGDVPAPLRGELASVVGTMRTTPQMTGSGLLGYVPE